MMYNEHVAFLQSPLGFRSKKSFRRWKHLKRKTNWGKNWRRLSRTAFWFKGSHGNVIWDLARIFAEIMRRNENMSIYGCFLSQLVPNILQFIGNFIGETAGFNPIARQPWWSTLGAWGVPSPGYTCLIGQSSNELAIYSKPLVGQLCSELEELQDHGRLQRTISWWIKMGMS